MSDRFIVHTANNDHVVLDKDMVQKYLDIYEPDHVEVAVFVEVSSWDLVRYYGIQNGTYRT